MLQFTEPVKFMGLKTRSGISSKTGKPYEITEARLYVNDLGRILVPVVGKPKFPEDGQLVNLRLSVDQGTFQSLRVVYDEISLFTLAK